MSLLVYFAVCAVVSASAEYPYTPADGYRYLQFSSAIYFDNPKQRLESALNVAFDQFEVVKKPCEFDSECVALVSTVNGDIVVSFRGTKYPMQLIDEIGNTVKVRPESVIGGNVHPFFQNGHQVLWPDLLSLVKGAKTADQGQHIYVTGHSLGGALAALFAARLSYEGHFTKNQIRVVTYGEPRVGDGTFAQNYDTLVPNTWRVTHHRDLVPHVPPCELLPWCQCDTATAYYYHHGTEVFYADEAMTIDSEYKICKGTPTNEDASCSNDLITKQPCINPVSCVNDHLFYFGVEVAGWHIPVIG